MSFNAFLRICQKQVSSSSPFFLEERRQPPVPSLQSTKSADEKKVENVAGSKASSSTEETGLKQRHNFVLKLALWLILDRSVLALEDSMGEEKAVNREDQSEENNENDEKE